VALPQQLKTARSSNATAVSSIDNVIGEVEQAVADILGVPVNTDITEVVTGRAKYAQIADSSAINATVTETAFDKSYTIPANILAVGNIIRIRASGIFTAAGAASINLRVRIGANVVLLHAQAVSTQTNAPWVIEGSAVVRSIGAAGVLAVGAGFGAFFLLNMRGNDSVVSSFTLDTTAGKVVDVTAQWPSFPGGTNTITMKTLTVELLPAASTS